MICSLLVALLLTPQGHSQINLTNALTVQAEWRPGSYPGGNGSVVLTVTDGAEVKREAIPLPSDSWPELDAPERPAALFSAGSNKEEAILDLTLSIESGVYGYRRVLSYLVTPRKGRLLTPIGEPFEFSDFGSWRRISSREIEFWDMVWNEDEAHQAPHRYSLTRILQSASGNKTVSVVKTKDSYEFSWDSTSNSKANPVPTEKDPLRELGTAWTWWGEPVFKSKVGNH